jgi:hypothetical protein
MGIRISSVSVYIVAKQQMQRIDNALESILIGGIAHELSHIIRDRNETFVEKLFYKFSARYRESIERDIDTEVILRGVGKELLSFTKYSCKEWSHHYKEDGLSLRELEKLV